MVKSKNCEGFITLGYSRFNPTKNPNPSLPATSLVSKNLNQLREKYNDVFVYFCYHISLGIFVKKVTNRYPSSNQAEGLMDAR